MRPLTGTGARPRRLALLLLGRLRRSSVWQHAVDLERTQKLAPDQLAAWQQERLHRLLCHARDTTDFYRSLIPSDLSPDATVEVLRSLPIVTRRMLKSETKRFVSRRFSERSLRLQHTSGSTGIPLAFWRDRDSLVRQKAEIAYFGSWAGYDFGARYLYIGPERSRLRGWVRNELSMWSTHPDDAWFAQLSNRLRARRVEILIGHPSVLIPLASFQVRSSSGAGGFPCLRGVVSISEPLTEEARLRIEQSLGCPVLRRYSTREVGIIASECEEKRYHVNVGSNYVELLGPEGDEPSPPEKPGRCVVTSLANYGMPFIRYDTGDIVTPDRTLCACGRRSPLLLRIEGRILDAITTSEGRTVEAFDICAEFEGFPEVAQFQFSQLLDGSYRILIVPSGPNVRLDHDGIARRFRGILGDSARIVVTQVDRISPLPSGKCPPVHRER